MTLLELADKCADRLRTIGHRAITEAHAAGVSAYYMIPGDDRIVREDPDGRRFFVEIHGDGDNVILDELDPHQKDDD